MTGEIEIMFKTKFVEDTHLNSSLVHVLNSFFEDTCALMLFFHNIAIARHFLLKHKIPLLFI